MSQACDTSVLPTSRPSVPVAGDAAPGHEVVFHAVVLSICGAALFLAAVLKPGPEGLALLGHRWPWHCWLHDTFGVRCALCGLSRSFGYLAHGDVAAALSFHRLGPLVFVMFCLEASYRTWAIVICPRRLGARLVRGHCVVAAAVAVLVFANWLLYLGGLLA